MLLNTDVTPFGKENLSCAVIGPSSPPVSIISDGLMLSGNLPASCAPLLHATILIASTTSKIAIKNKLTFFLITFTLHVCALSRT